MHRRSSAARGSPSPPGVIAASSPRRRRSSKRMRRMRPGRQPGDGGATLQCKYLGRAGAMDKGILSQTDVERLLQPFASGSLMLQPTGQAAVAAVIKVPRQSDDALAATDAATGAVLVTFTAHTALHSSQNRPFRRLLLVAALDGFDVLSFPSSLYIRYIESMHANANAAAAARLAGSPSPTSAFAESVNDGVQRRLQEAPRKYHAAMTALASLDDFLVRESSSDEEGAVNPSRRLSLPFWRPVIKIPPPPPSSLSPPSPPLSECPSPPPEHPIPSGCYIVSVASPADGEGIPHPAPGVDLQLQQLLRDLEALVQLQASDTVSAPRFHTTEDGLRVLALS